MKIVALAFATYHSGIAAVSVDSDAPALRKVNLFSFSEDYLQVFPINGKDSIRLSEGFLPNGIAFGPGNDEITLTSWNSVRTLNLRDGKVTPIPPPTFRDQFMRLIVGPGDYATRLVATSLYGRVHVAKGAQQGKAGRARGLPRLNRISTVQFGWPTIADFIRRNVQCVRQRAPRRRQSVVSAAGRLHLKTSKTKPAPPWLADIASAVSASDPSQDGSLMTLEDVRKKYPESKAGDPYESVWKRFFPDEPQR